MHTGRRSASATLSNRQESSSLGRGRRALIAAVLAIALLGAALGLPLLMATLPGTQPAREAAPVQEISSSDAQLGEPPAAAPQETPAIQTELAEIALPAIPPPYTVEAGDSLLGIALRFETTVEVLELLNGLSDPEVVQIGQVLTVPPPQVSLESVDPSQTLRDVAQLHGLDAVTLAAYNGRGPQDIDAPRGRDKVLIPVRSSTAEVRPTGEGPTAGNAYTVEEGDTMSSIAQKLGIDLDVLKAANARDDPDVIAVGEQLRIPQSE